jgi:glutathione peroxidase
MCGGLVLTPLFAVASARAQAPGSGLARTEAACPPLLSHRFLRLQDERPVSLCDLAGQVLLVVNTASLCGYTPQYRGLEALHQRHAARGFSVLGFPSNDFGSQEPGSNRDIAAFCENTFGVRFPMFAKTRVTAAAGRERNALFAELAERTGQSPRWNFHKYLISRSGREVRSFASDVDPQNPALVAELQKWLDQRA